MALTIDYYFAPNSPWTYLGHERFAQIAAAAGAGGAGGADFEADAGGVHRSAGGHEGRHRLRRHAPLPPLTRVDANPTPHPPT